MARAAVLALTVLLLCLSATPSGAASERETESWLNLGATVGLRWGIQTRDAETQMAILRIEPEADVSLPYELRVHALARLGGDFSDNLEPGRPYQRSYADGTQPQYAGDWFELELRELYVDANAGPAQLRLGKQQVVWGQADGIRLLDAIDPQDFREFILEDFDQSRIPLWSAKVELPIRNWTFQMLWVPDSTYNLFAGLDEVEPEDPYAFTTDQFRPQVPERFESNAIIHLESADRPTWELTRSDLGAQISTVLGAWDFSLNALYQFDDTPVLDLSYDRFGIIDGEIGALIVAKPIYRRRMLVGGSFSRAIRSFTLRGEIATSLDRTYTTDPAIRFVTDLSEPERFEPQTGSEVSYLLGVDWYGLPSGVISLQFVQAVIVDHNKRMLRDQYTQFATLAIRRSFMNERLTPELLWYTGFAPWNGLLRAKLGYEVRSGMQIFAGADVFYGDENGVFGQFDSNDRIVLGFELGF